MKISADELRALGFRLCLSGTPCWPVLAREEFIAAVRSRKTYYPWSGHETPGGEIERFSAFSLPGSMRKVGINFLTGGQSARSCSNENKQFVCPFGPKLRGVGHSACVAPVRMRVGKVMTAKQTT